MSAAPKSNNHNVTHHKRKRASSPSKRPIYLVVVESHQHVLEHIHTVLRKERLLTDEWSMLHFDAHPDLACPHSSIPAKACFLPHEMFPTPVEGEEKNLYELLDSTATGIAEWILPLVLAANLRQVHWVKQTTSNTMDADQYYPSPPSQLPLGIHEYRVGAAVARDNASQEEAKIESFMDLPDSAVVKVDWPHPYYLEDNCAVHFGQEDSKKESFHLDQPFQLHISELSNRNEQDKSNNPQPNNDRPTANKTDLWALDICLDYFACQNPFLTDLEAKDPVYTRALLHAVYQSRFYSSSIMDSTPTSSIAANTGTQRVDELTTSPRHYRRNLHKFWRFLLDLLHESVKGKNATANSSVNDIVEPHKKTLEEYYTDASVGQECIKGLINAFLVSPCCASIEEENENENEQLLISMTEQILPNLMMPHSCSVHVACGDASEDKTGPVFKMDKIRPVLKQVQETLESNLLARQDAHHGTSMKRNPPFIVTIARSSNDGFTPCQIADELQNELVQFLHTIYCGCPRVIRSLPVASHMQEEDVSTRQCRFQIVLDYDICEGSSF